MQTPDTAKAGQWLVIWAGGVPHPGALVRLVAVRTDSNGGITKSPCIHHRGKDYFCAWAKMRRVTPFTLPAAQLIRLWGWLWPLMQRYLLGTL